ncbi:hypothetical protein CFP56_018584 [Quercus suber]|uniref:Uncharacterized protein n=1 Tax=Quercus suber TaxID=58331 RepID=A0AAW0M223_QUESU
MHSTFPFCYLLVSRAIRAAQGLASIQFSPTSEHILLPHGRRHGSLLKSYRVSDMELVGVLPSVEDEVWSMLLAFIHLLEEVLLLEERCGWVRKGKPRVLQCDGARGVNCTGSNYIPEENMAFVG